MQEQDRQDSSSDAQNMSKKNRQTMNSNKKPLQRPTTEQRRVVKASVPPPASEPTDLNPTLTSNEDEEGSKSKDVTGRESLPPGMAPSVEDQQQRERSEKLKQERLQETVAIGKEHREKEVDQRRKSGPSSGAEKGSEGAVDDIQATERRDLPPIFSVAPQTPKHKLTSPELNRNEEPSEKKFKVGLDAPPGQDGDDGGDRPSGWANFSGWVASAAAVALVVVIAVKVLKKKT